MNKYEIISARPDLRINKLSCIIQIDTDGSKDHNMHMQQIFDRFIIDIHKRVNIICLIKIHFVKYLMQIYTASYSQNQSSILK